MGLDRLPGYHPLMPRTGSVDAPDSIDVDWHFVSSSNVLAIRRTGPMGDDGQGGENLEVSFRAGKEGARAYIYVGAGHHFAHMLQAESKGTYLNQQVKPYYEAWLMT